MTIIDWLIVAGYFAAIAALTSWVMKRRRDTADDYFLASRHLGWFVVGASIFASNIGSEHLVGLAGAGATSGVALAHYELHAWCLLVLGWVMVPFYARTMVFTMPEFLERRYSPAARSVLSIISLVAYVDRKSTRLNSSHSQISYAVFCLKKKKLFRLDTPIIFIEARINLSRFVVTGCAANTSATVTFPTLKLLSLFTFCFTICVKRVPP